MDIEVQFAGLTELLRRFGNLGPVTRAMDGVMAAWVRQVVRSRFAGMGNYAPPRPGSDYIRTGTLGAGWQATMRGPLQHRITNPVLYAPYVVGEQQAWMHRGRWWTARRRLDAATPDMLNAMAQAAAQTLETGRQSIASGGRSAIAALFGFGRGGPR